MKVTTLLVLISIGVSGCTTGKALSEAPEFWYNDQKTVLIFNWSDVYYCKNNKDPQSGKVKPACYQAEMVSPIDRSGHLSHSPEFESK